MVAAPSAQDTALARELREALAAERAAREAAVEALRAELRAEAASLRARLDGREAPQEGDRCEAPSTEQLSASGSDVKEPVTGITHVFQQSMWDAALFIGLPCFGVGGSALASIILCLNMILPVIFMNSIAVLTRDGMFMSVDEARKWRESTGHNHVFYDKTTHTSLVQRVCSDAPSLEMSTDRAQVIDDILLYGGHDGWDLLGDIGPAMCMTALVVWYSTVVTEVRSLFNLVWALHALPCGKTRLVATEDGFQLVAIAKGRRFWIMALTLVRLAIAVGLVIFGTIYLVRTTSVSELLLNAIALEVVLNVDEMLFGALAPSCVRKLIGGLKPLHATHPSKPWRGADKLTVIWLLTMFAGVAAVAATGISGTMDEHRQIYHEMCEGTTNFVYGINSLGAVITTDTTAEDTPRGTDLPYVLPVHERIWGTPEGLAKLDLDASPFTLFEGLIGHSVSETVNTVLGVVGASCVDLLDGNGVLQRLTQHIGLSGSCSGLGHLCRSEVWVRADCPRTCGCDSPFSGLLLTGTAQGCPAGCASTAAYAEALAAAPCAEQSAHNLRSTASWPAWAEQFEAHQETWGYAPPPGVDSWRRLFLDLGCQFIPLYINWYREIFGAIGHPCTRDWDNLGFPELRSLAPICPITCGCNASHVVEAVRRDCPLKCAPLANSSAR